MSKRKQGEQIARKQVVLAGSLLQNFLNSVEGTPEEKKALKKGKILQNLKDHSQQVIDEVLPDMQPLHGVLCIRCKVVHNPLDMYKILNPFVSEKVHRTGVCKTCKPRYIPSNKFDIEFLDDPKAENPENTKELIRKRDLKVMLHEAMMRRQS